MTKEKEKENKAAEAVAVAAPEKQRELVLNPATAEQQGTVQVTSNVIAQIVKKNVLQVEGVARFVPKGMADIVNVFSSRSYDSSIGSDKGSVNSTLRFTDGTVAVSIAVLAYIGTCLPKMAQEIQDKVRSQIVEVTGAAVSKVNVVIKDLVAPDEVVPEEEVSETQEAE